MIDFIFTAQAVRVLRACGVTEARRAPAERLASASFALVTFGIGRLCQVRETKTE
jgi:hypothetical protein